MKNVLVLGVAKSGKTYLAKRINKNRNYSYIPLDYFTSSFKHNFSETKITSNVVIDRKSSKNLSKFLSRVIEIIDYVNNENYIIDSAHIYPEDIINYIDRDKWDIYCIGYLNISVEEKFSNLRKYVHGGWPAKRNDDELNKTITKLIEISKEMEKQCNYYNIRFIDSSNFENLDKLQIEKE